MKKISWLDEFAQKQASKKAEKKVVAKKVTKAQIENSDKMIIAKSLLPKAVEGNTVKYKGFKWKVVNANLKDSKGYGIVLQKIAGIDTKPLTAPAERAMTDPGNVYDYNVRETSEIPDFEQAAQATAEQIAKEDAVDHCTTPDARYKNEALMDNGVADVPSMDAPVDAPVEEAVEAPVDGEDDFSFDDVDVPAEDVVEDEAPVEEEVPADDVADEDVPVVEEEATEDAPVVEEEDDFSFDDVDAEPLDEEEDKEEVKASVKRRKNRILAAMLKH